MGKLCVGLRGVQPLQSRPHTRTGRHEIAEGTRQANLESDVFPALQSDGQLGQVRQRSLLEYRAKELASIGQRRTSFAVSGGRYFTAAYRPDRCRDLRAGSKFFNTTTAIPS